MSHNFPHVPESSVGVAAVDSGARERKVELTLRGHIRDMHAEQPLSLGAAIVRTP